MVYRGRLDAKSDDDAAEKVYDLHPKADNVVIIGPMPDGRWEWLAFVRSSVLSVQTRQISSR